MQTKSPETTTPYLFGPERRVNYHEPLEIGPKAKLLIAAGALLTAVAVGNLWHRAFGGEDGGQA